MMPTLPALVVLLGLIWPPSVMAQDTTATRPGQATISANLDVVNRYYWRYVVQDAPDPVPHVQPAVTVRWRGLEAQAWASAGLGNQFVELDLIVAYRRGPLRLSYNHYLLDKRDTSEAYGELIATFEGGRRLPITLLAGLFVYGDARHSTYLEASYPLRLGAQLVALSIGTSPSEGFYTVDASPGLVQLGVKVSRKVRVAGRTLSPFAGYSYNPDANRDQVLFGASLY